MGQQVDAVIIGAGVIGTATAFELGKRGYKTLNIDKLPSAGYGPTSNSCAIVRAHYSSFDGVAMAYEGFFYWKKWAEYLEAPDESGLAKYMMAGTVLLESATGHHDKVLPHYDRLGVPYEVWDTATTSPPRARRSCRAPSTRPTPATSTIPRCPRTTSSAPPRREAASSSTAAR